MSKVAQESVGSRRAPPFRADVVGSFIRPARLTQARERLLGPQTPDQHLGPHANAELRAVEDECIREVVAMQERAGMQAATDGEFRRRSWWLDLIMGWKGFAADRQGTTEMMWRNKQGATQPFSRLWINAPIEWRGSATVRALEFLKANTRLVPKVTLPAPILVHMYACGDWGVREGHYKDLDQFWADVTAAYRREVEALVAAGATYIQFDDTSIAFLCDPMHRETVTRWGTPPDDLLKIYARRLNDVVASVPDDVTVTLHQCRGNREANWGAEGGYDPVGRGAVQRDRRRRIFPRIRHRARRRLCAAAAPAQGQDRRARHHVEQIPGSRGRRLPQGPHRAGGAVCADRTIGDQPAMRLRQLDRRPADDESAGRGKACAPRRGRSKRLAIDAPGSTFAY
jgi:5-methyltetrahydropteroyltriglutamate--homocysteine methyltransferase